MYRAVVRALVSLFFCALPFATHAAVVIDEIAWMGDTDSANNEWIELYNNGQQNVSLDGWTLTDHDALSISLSGTLHTGAYGVLERTDDDSAPGNAFLVYTGALSNGGATLTLLDGNGSVRDIVNGNNAWQDIGGDNSTKETAQLTNNGWVTAAPTPGAANADTNSTKTTAPDVPDTSASSTRIQSADQTGSDPEPLSLPTTSLQLSIGAPTNVYVDQVVSFKARPSGITGASLDSLQYRWNFGDLGTTTGKAPTHVFTHPGQYVVTLRAHYSYHTQNARVQVTVLPIRFSLIKNDHDDIQVRNDAKYEVDVSGYMAVADGRVRFPKGTILLPNETLTIPKQRLSLSEYSTVTLFDQPGNAVARRTFTTPVAHIARAQVAPANDPPVYTTAQPVTSTTASNTESMAKTKHITPSSSALQARASAAGKIPDDVLSLIGLIGVIVVSIGAVYASGARQHDA